MSILRSPHTIQFFFIHRTERWEEMKERRRKKERSWLLTFSQETPSAKG
jgi:hypothetical protein